MKLNKRFLNVFVFFLIACATGCFFPVSATQTAAEGDYQFKGEHFLASYLDCDAKALTDLKHLEQAMLSAANQSGATILKSTHWVFPPDGFTMVILLSESHASIHTYPEQNACFVDLFTCGENCSSVNFDTALREYLKPKKVACRTFLRGAEIEEKP
ncbi:MAG TPA: adenosylmethionine decarboxylase [Rhabdochlamydiaceae bacterium]|jgi:S-adenosylmethionine decarboxylase